MVKDKHNKRPEEPAAMGAGDSQLDISPPNVEETQPPAPAIVSPPEHAAAGGGEAAAGGPEAANGAGGPQTAAPADGPAGVAQAAGDGQPAGGGMAAALEEELGALRRDARDAADRHLRLAAEFENYRKRVERERAETWSRAQAELAVRLLETIDDLERVAHHTESATAQALHEGVQLIERKLRAALAAAGLEEVAAENASFDPRVMEAVAVVPAENPEDDDVVSDVFQRGYLFKGQLLRPARVRVKKHD